MASRGSNVTKFYLKWCPTMIFCTTFHRFDHVTRMGRVNLMFIWRFAKKVPQSGFIYNEHRMDDLGVPPFMETLISRCIAVPNLTFPLQSELRTLAFCECSAMVRRASRKSACSAHFSWEKPLEKTGKFYHLGSSEPTGKLHGNHRTMTPGKFLGLAGEPYKNLNQLHIASHSGRGMSNETGEWHAMDRNTVGATHSTGAWQLWRIVLDPISCSCIYFIV